VLIPAKKPTFLFPDSPLQENERFLSPPLPAASCSIPMSDTHPPVSTWCEALQRKLMDAIDAAWALAEKSDDPAVIAKVRDKARLAGQLAAEARRIAALVPPRRTEKPRLAPTALREAFERMDAAVAAPPEPAEAKPPAAQAAAMRAALAKMGRR